MARVIWSAERGWHDDGPEARVTLDARGRLVIIPDPEPIPDHDDAA